MNRRAPVLERFRRRARTPAAALFRRVFVINGLVFTLGTLILALSPATVSARIRVTEIPVLVVGLAVILTANALLLRSSLAPLDQLANSMRRVDPPHRSDRIDDRRNSDLHHVIASFNAMLDRLDRSGPRRARQHSRRRKASANGLRASCTTKSARASPWPCSPSNVSSTGRRRNCGPICHDTQETVRASLDEVRSIARRLRPDTLEDLGLHSALNALCNEFTHGTGIVVTNTSTRNSPG